MKKLIPLFMMIAGVGASFGASAQTALPPNGGPVTTTACTVLSEQVTLNLSKGVHGAFNCDEATNAIKVATCHEAGSRKPTTVNCVAQGSEPDITYTPAGCAAGVASVEISDYRAFTANSRGGGVGTAQLGGACTDSSLSGLGGFW
ncbi:hypothetical protein [Thauera sinica]|uniref:Cyanovirin-N domain-containing protein n=1 Tax=Thauera sinica TaxID=2665146 RepID=A0ABW1AXM0_9RHOO|nr:hypothetical protein [Thauera sp. K11]